VRGSNRAFFIKKNLFSMFARIIKMQKIYLNPLSLTLTLSRRERE
jgi:hypothetical protein